MNGGSTPPSTMRLAQLLQNPDLLQMKVDYHSTREAFLEVSDQLNDFKRIISIFESAESDFARVNDLKDINKNIEKLSTSIDQNSDEFSKELSDVRAYFQFQIKELNAKVDKNLSKVIDELSKQASLNISNISGNVSTTALINDNTMREEINTLKERFDSVFNLISKSDLNMKNYIEEEEEEDSNEKKSDDHNENGESEIENESGNVEKDQNESQKNEAESIDENKNINNKKLSSISTPTNLNSSGSLKLPPSPLVSTNENENLEVNEPEQNQEAPATQANTKQKNKQSAQINKLSKLMDLKFEDLRIQIESINNILKKYEDSLLPLVPIVQKNTADIDLIRPDLIKAKTDVIFLKGDIERIKDSQADSVVDYVNQLKKQAEEAHDQVIPDIEKPMAAMRNQFINQLSKMENAFNEQIKKLKAEISSLKGSTNENQDLAEIAPQEDLDDHVVSIASEFAKEEPAEKSLIDEMHKNAEEARKKKQEELENLTKEVEITTAKAKEDREKEIQQMMKEEEEKFSNESARAVEKMNGPTYSEAEVQTETDDLSFIKKDIFTEVKNLPNHLIVSIIADSPPSKTVENDEISKNNLPRSSESDLSKQPDIPNVQQQGDSVKVTDRNIINDNTGLNPSMKDGTKTGDVNSTRETNQVTPTDLIVWPTEAYEYVHIENNVDNKALSLVKRDILRHQGILEKIVNQISDNNSVKIEIPPIESIALPSEEEQIPILLGNQNELSDIKTVCYENKEMIESLKNKIQELENIKPSPVDDQNSQLPIKPQIISLQPNQIILTPVQFSPLEITPLNVFNASSQQNKAGKAANQGKAKKKRFRKASKKAQVPPNEDAPAPANSDQTNLNAEDIQKTGQLEDGTENPENESNHVDNDDEIDTLNELDVEFDDRMSERKERSKDNLSGHSSAHKSSRSKSSRHHHHHKHSHHHSHPSSPDKNTANESKQSDQSKENEADDKNEQNEEQTKEEAGEPANAEQEEKPQQSETSSSSDSDSSEFFSAADSDVGNDIILSSSYSEEEEEEEEGYEMDPPIKEKFDELTNLINTHHDQIKNIREGLVELRTNFQVFKCELKEPVKMLPQLETPDVTAPSQSEGHQDDAAIRALRRRMDSQTRELEQDLYKIRKEILEIKQEQAKQPQKVTERIIQIQAPTSHESKKIPIPVQEVDPNQTAGNPADSIFEEEEKKLMNIKPLKLPGIKDDKKNKAAKPLIIDNPKTPDAKSKFILENNSTGNLPGPLEINTIQTRPKTPNSSKLPPINTPTTPVEKPGNDEKEEINDSRSDSGSNAPKGSHFFNNVVHQTVDELKILNAAEQVDEHIVNLIIEVRAQLMLLIGNNTNRIVEIESKIGNFVDKDFVQKFFQKMRSTINEINSNVDIMKQTLPDRVTKDEVQSIIEELYHNLTSDKETSGGTQSYRCLLCGRPKTAISGMIRDFKVAETLGQPQQATVAQSPNSGSRATLIYGPDKQAYRGKGNFGKPTIAAVDSKKALPKMK